MLGTARLLQKKYAEAEPLLLQGYEGTKARVKSPPNPEIVQAAAAAADRIIELYRAMNKPELVDKWQAERKKYSVSTPPVKTK